MKIKGKYSRGRRKSIWEEVHKDVTEREGRIWEQSKDKELQKDRDRQSSLMPTS
jgi:hypothetical protein